MPPGQPRFARVAAAIGDPTLALMLSRLLDGRCYTATELAEHAGVAASTASQHLKLLVDDGLAQVRANGRHRCFMLDDADVAHALEALLRVAGGGDARVASRAQLLWAFGRRAWGAAVRGDGGAGGEEGGREYMLTPAGRDGLA